VIQAIVTREDDVDRSILVETVGMLRATGIQAYDFEIGQITTDDSKPLARECVTEAPRLLICCVDPDLSTVDALRTSVGFQLAAAAAIDGAATLTVRHCIDGGNVAANRSAEYVTEVAVHISESPPPHPAVLHLDLHAAPGFRRVHLTCGTQLGNAFAFPVGTYHLTLTPIALESAQSSAVSTWATNLFEKLYPSEPTSLDCACCAGTSFFTRLICNQRSPEDDEN
jgi:hypothetical protein